MRKILYITGTRADYGLARPILFAIKNDHKLKVELAVTGMHLMHEFGFTINEIKKDSFTYHVIDATYEKDNKASMSYFLGKFIIKLTKKLQEIKPDIILLLGDRAEQLAAAIVGAYLNIPVAHLHGGEKTSTVDELARHAITKFAHIHLPATKQSAQRIKKLGEDKWRIHVVGSPGIDSIKPEIKPNKKEICRKLNFDPNKPIAIIAQHPVTPEEHQAAFQMQQTMEAIKELKLQAIITYPNADAGGRRMIKVIEQYKNLKNIRIFKSIPHSSFINLLKISDVIIGNTSSAIIEAPSLKLPAVNIGSRQLGREHSNNIINANYKKEEIIKAIKKALSQNFRKKLTGKNPYGDGKTANRVAKILSKIKVNEKLIQKQITY